MCWWEGLSKNEAGEQNPCGWPQPLRFVVLWSPYACVTEDAKISVGLLCFAEVKPKPLLNLLNFSFRFSFSIFFLSFILEHVSFIQEDKYAKRERKRLKITHLFRSLLQA